MGLSTLSFASGSDRSGVIDRGRPESDTEQLGSFERWASITGGVVHHIGIEGFLGNLSELYETASEEEHEWSRLLESIAEWASNGDKVASFTTKELSEDLKDHAHSGEWKGPGVHPKRSSRRHPRASSVRQPNRKEPGKDVRLSRGTPVSRWVAHRAGEWRPRWCQVDYTEWRF